MNDVLAGLNTEQQRAVVTLDGPLLILAGAGSGKTKTLTHRIAHIIHTTSTWPSHILAVTFTNKAAREMRQRLAVLLGEDPNARDFMPWMGTFHSICVRLLRIDGQAIGVPKNFIIYDEDDRRSLIKRAMKQCNITDKQIKPAAASGIISAEKNKLNDPAAVIASAQYPYQQAVGQIYQTYEQLKEQAGALDFDDLLLQTVQLLRTQPSIRRKWQAQFRYILIDEYQDTNAAQYEIVSLLVGEQKNICVVGDDWQSIYSWRGADFKNILRFEQDYPGAAVVKLEQNYRNTGAILAAAQSVITKNKERTSKTLWTEAGDGLPVSVYAARDETDEAAFIAERIASSVRSAQHGYSDFAVLYRTNAQSYAIERALNQRFIPLQVVGGMRFFDRAVIKDVMAYVRLCYQPRDTASFMRIANVPTRGIGATSLAKFMQWQGSTTMDIIESLTRAHEAPTLAARARNALQALGDTLRLVQVKISEGTAPSELISYVVDVTGYRTFISDGTAQAEDKLENIATLIEEARAYADLETYLEEVALMSSSDTASQQGSVTLMTLHAAKGLEFPVVFMAGMEEGVFPHARTLDADPAELEEERRLCYVGMTRARQELYLSHAAMRYQFNQRSYNQPSRFLRDAELTDDAPSEPHVLFESDYSDVCDEPDIAIGQRVRSAVFGPGTVEEIDGLAVVVEFDSGQRKKLNYEYARLERLS